MREERTKMNRFLNSAALQAVLLVLSMIVGSGCDSSDEDRNADVSTRSEPGPDSPATTTSDDETSSPLTVVLHVTGMMKSKSGAT